MCNEYPSKREFLKKSAYGAYPKPNSPNQSLKLEKIRS